MRNSVSMPFARMVMMENAMKIKSECPDVKGIIEENCYANDITISNDERGQALSHVVDIII